MCQRGRIWQSRASLSTQYVHIVQDVELPFIVGGDEVRWIFRWIRHLQLPVQGLGVKKWFSNSVTVACSIHQYIHQYSKNSFLLAVKGSKNWSWIPRRTLAMTPWRLLAWRKSERCESGVCLNHTVVCYQIASALVFSHSVSACRHISSIPNPKGLVSSHFLSFLSKSSRPWQIIASLGLG